jgi:hypothetical protein
MLNSVLKDAIKKRDETLSILKGPEFERISNKPNQIGLNSHLQNRMLPLLALIVASIVQNFRVLNYGQ